MSLLGDVRSVRTGSQSPSFICKPRVRTVDTFDAQDAVDLAAAFGLVADEWQEGVISGALGRDADGRLTARSVGLSVPRQNGKNGVLEVVELAQMVLLGRRVLHTAHEVKTSRKAFIRLASYFEDNEELAGLVKSIRRVNGQEHILLTTGGSCEFIARSKSSGRGYSVETLVLDEAQELSEEALAALLPTISASGDKAQIILTGTPPAPSDVHGEVFRRTHDAAHEGSDKSLFWVEWSVLTPGDGAQIDEDDRALWFQANPALGVRITEETVAAERAIMSDDTFRRERLGMWELERTSRVIPLEDWQACADSNLLDDGEPVTLAIDVAPDRDAASIVACGMTVDGHPWVDVVENRRGTPEWIVPRLKAILDKQPVRAVLIDVLSPAGSFIELLEAENIKVSRTGSAIMAAACGQFYDAVMSHDLRHVDQVPLNLAVASARKRRLGDSWAWNRSSQDADITPLVAATLALTGRTFSKAKRPVRAAVSERKVVVW